MASTLFDEEPKETHPFFETIEAIKIAMNRCVATRDEVLEKTREDLEKACKERDEEKKRADCLEKALCAAVETQKQLMSRISELGRFN